MTATPWTRRYHEARETAPTLVCLPHAGGSASFFHPFSRALSPEVEVLAVQYPGRQERHREPGVTDMAALVRLVAEDLAPLFGGDGPPPVLFGHSMGAVLAFEAALTLEREHGLSPTHLVLSGRRPPSRHTPPTGGPLTDAELIRETAALQGTDPQALADPDILSMVLPALRADHLALWGHRNDPGAVVSCPITALGGEEDPLLPVADVGAWAGHTSGGYAGHTMPGGHFFLVDRLERVVSVLNEVCVGARV